MIDTPAVTPRSRDDRFELGVTYWPADVGPYMWHEFSEPVVRRDLAAIAAMRIPTIRVLLAWDAFMPTDRTPSARRIRDLETLLTAARELGLSVVVTLFAQSLGDCVMLPSYAVDRRVPRAGVRCVTDARVVAGGPRDIYADPLMLEVQVRWLDAMLAAFAAHPAIAAWDLGHDPATTVRPRRTAEMAAWAALLAERIHGQQERCRLTLGQGDVVRARGVRLAAMSEHVDDLGLALRPQRLALPGDPLDPDRGVFVMQLAQALAGSSASLVADIAIASGNIDDSEGVGSAVADRVTAPSDDAARATDALLQRVVESGAAGAHAAAWCDWGARLLQAPPADRRPWMARLGIVDTIGDAKPVADPWRSLAGSEPAVYPRSQYPAAIDVESYYGNLPDSLLDLYATWRAERGDRPAILG